METKVCRSCGRVMEWRKKWASNWDAVRYCSKACRGQKLEMRDTQLERLLLDQVAAQPGGTGITPEQVIHGWVQAPKQNARERVLRAGRRLAQRGLVEFRHQGRGVDPSTFKGPVSIRLKPGVKAP